MADLNTVGPNSYLLPTTIGYDNHDPRKIRRPQYSMGIRLPMRGATSDGPGPRAYVYDKMTRYGKEYTPAFSFGYRTEPAKQLGKNPGPGKYNLRDFPDFRKKFPPAFSFGVKHKDFTSNQSKTPAPNVYKYNINSFKPSAPAFSIYGRTTQKLITISPGPKYYIENWNLILPKSPAFSLSGRYGTIKATTNMPGPNAYDIKMSKTGNQSPAFSFGIKHSPRAPPLITPCDN